MKEKRWLLSLYLLCMVTSVSVFVYYIYIDTRYSDHMPHIEFAANLAKAQAIPNGSHRIHGRVPHILYHLILNLLTGFSANLEAIKIAAIFLLTVAILLKVKLSSSIFVALTEKHNIKVPRKKETLLLLMLVFASPIVNWWNFPSIYMGQFTPNVWHNSTTIMSIPFALAIFFLIEKQQNQGARDVIYGSILLGLSTLLKPNFTIAFLPVLFLLVLLKRYSLKDLVIYSVPVIIILLWQISVTYKQTGSGVEFAPMLVWGIYSKHPIFSLILSFAFPLAVTIFFIKHLKNANLVLFAWILVVIALVQFILFAEKGPRLLHANFYWGIVPSLYILFLVLIVELTSVPIEKLKTYKTKYLICYFLLFLHFISGILFYLRTLRGSGWNA